MVQARVPAKPPVSGPPVHSVGHSTWLEVKPPVYVLTLTCASACALHNKQQLAVVTSRLLSLDVIAFPPG
jgi:hypothetical protein